MRKCGREDYIDGKYGWTAIYDQMEENVLDT
jgi:hypothetical protein